MGANEEEEELARRGSAMDLVGPKSAVGPPLQCVKKKVIGFTRNIKDAGLRSKVIHRGKGRYIVSEVRLRMRAIMGLLTKHDTLRRHFQWDSLRTLLANYVVEEGITLQPQCVVCYALAR